MWPDRRLIELFKIELPIVQAPMAGAIDWELIAAAAEAGALGSLPCAMLNAQQIREQMGKIRAHTKKPVNLNFFCHSPAVPSNAREARWRERLEPYYRELAIDPAAPVPSSNRTAFDSAMCDVVEETKPEVVSFHFGLPEPGLLRRLKAAGSLVMGSATTAAEARWLEARGVDAVIAQGNETATAAFFSAMTSRPNPEPSRSFRRSLMRSPSPSLPPARSPTGAASRPPSRSGLPGCRSAPRICGAQRRRFRRPTAPRSNQRATTRQR